MAFSVYEVVRVTCLSNQLHDRQAMQELCKRENSARRVWNWRSFLLAFSFCFFVERGGNPSLQTIQVRSAFWREQSSNVEWHLSRSVPVKFGQWSYSPLLPIDMRPLTAINRAVIAHCLRVAIRSQLLSRDNSCEISSVRTSLKTGRWKIKSGVRNVSNEQIWHT